MQEAISNCPRAQRSTGGHLAYAARVSGQVVRRHEDSKAATASQLVGKFGTDAAAFARCSLGSEAASVAGQVNAVCSD